jgi:hypothetical protein
MTEHLSPAARVWLAWTALSTVVAVASAYAVGIVIRTSIETGILLFAGGLAWASLTPLVIRRIGRWLRG